MISRDLLIWIWMVTVLELETWSVVTGHPFPVQPQEQPIVKPPGAAASESQFRICGPRIKEMVNVICRARSYSPKGRPQREIMNFLGSGEELLPRRSYRSVIEECCWNNCTPRKLLRYCGSNIQLPTAEEPRFVSLQDFLKKLAEFFKQQESPPSTIYKVEPWDEGKSFKTLELEGTSEEINQPETRLGLTIYSDEIPKDLESSNVNSIVRNSFHSPIVRMYQPGSKVTYPSGIQEIRAHERPEHAVVIRDTM